MQRPFATPRACPEEYEGAGCSRTRSTRRGITVLALLLLIIAAIIAAVFLVRYLRSRPAAASAPSTTVIPNEVRNLLHGYWEAAV